MASGILAFDELLAMAQEPERLEAYRQREVRSIIERAPYEIRRRLRGLQFQVDAHRRLHNDSPIGACIQLSKMMQDSFYKLHTYLTQTTREAASPLPEPKNTAARSPKYKAKVIPLPLKNQ